MVGPTRRTKIKNNTFNWSVLVGEQQEVNYLWFWSGKLVSVFPFRFVRAAVVVGVVAAVVVLDENEAIFCCFTVVLYVFCCCSVLRQQQQRCSVTFQYT